MEFQMSTFHQMIESGVERVRLKTWGRYAFIRLRLRRQDGNPAADGIGELYDPPSFIALNREEPIPVNVANPVVVAGDDWEPYTGPKFDVYHYKSTAVATGKNAC